MKRMNIKKKSHVPWWLLGEIHHIWDPQCIYPDALVKVKKVRNYTFFSTLKIKSINA